ncbi:MAG TPA: hypothetical protein VF077_13160 [Nitrospiraceae bacterium]
MKLIIATGTRGNDIYFGLVQFMADAVRRFNAEIIFGECSWSAVRAQEFIVKQLADRDYDYVLHVDADVAPPMDTIDKLTSLNLDIVGVPVWMADYCDVCINIHRHGNCERIRSKPDSGVESVNHISFACILIHRNVFERFKARGESPFHASALAGHDRDGVPDLIFNAKAIAMGYKLHVCWGVKGAVHNRPIRICDEMLHRIQTAVGR